MTSVFCLHLHTAEPAAVPMSEAVKSRATDETISVWTKCTEWECLIWSGPSLDRRTSIAGGNSIRDSEKMERVRARQRKTDRKHLWLVPGWFESLRNKRITLNGFNVLYPSHLLLQRSSLWNTCSRDGDQWTKKVSHTDPETHMLGYDTQTTLSGRLPSCLKGPRFHLDLADCVLFPLV